MGGAGVVIVLAAGCFWSVELVVQRLPGVASTRVGYIGGDADRHTCEQIHNPLARCVCVQLVLLACAFAQAQECAPLKDASVTCCRMRLLDHTTCIPCALFTCFDLSVQGCVVAMGPLALGRAVLPSRALLQGCVDRWHLAGLCSQGVLTVGTWQGRAPQQSVAARVC
jgi:hypothetical protein